MQSRNLVIAFILVILLLLSSAPVLEAGPSSPDVLISRVCPTYPGEFVSITNHGPSIDLKGWRLSDGEGSISINATLILASGSSLSWCESPERGSALCPDDTVLWKNSTCVALKGSMKLADKGDEVMLYDGLGQLVDVLYYGTSEPSSPWNGPAVECRKGEMLVRDIESIGSAAWSTEVPGTFTMRTDPVAAMVTPILYPGSALETTVREIDDCRESIRLAVYLLENWTLARHLSMAEARGVNVTVLLEGCPVGGISENGAALAYYLKDAGAEVWIMRSSDSFRRYDYLHAKYIIFDEERLLVCSENMADSSYSKNRGWGLLVDSRSLARSAMAIFDRDIAGKGVDIFPLELSVARQDGTACRALESPGQATVPIRATVTLATSPFSIEDAIVEMLDSAEERVLVQQMSIDSSWLNGGAIMESLTRAAERGASVRILMDANIGTEEENREVEGSLNSLAERNGWDLQCRLMGDDAGYDRIHNKGLVTDDTVLVGSANWVNNSMQCNREIALIVRSGDVASSYAEWFMDDWKGDPNPPSISLPWNYIEVSEGTLFTLDATGCSDTSGIADFNWDLDGDGSGDLHGPLHSITMPCGLHNFTLTVTDTVGNNASATISVNVVGSEQGNTAFLIYVPIPVLAVILLLVRCKRRIY